MCILCDNIFFTLRQCYPEAVSRQNRHASLSRMINIKPTFADWHRVSEPKISTVLGTEPKKLLINYK